MRDKEIRIIIKVKEYDVQKVKELIKEFAELQSEHRFEGIRFEITFEITDLVEI